MKTITLVVLLAATVSCAEPARKPVEAPRDRVMEKFRELEAKGLAVSIEGMRFVRIPAGTFVMGALECDRRDQRPLHRVSLDAFRIGMTEVTQGQYDSVMGKNPSHPQGGDLPVNFVTWRDAAEFCRCFGKRHGVPARLPTEAEWEYACRAGSETPYFWGERMDGAYGWYADGYNPYHIQPVGRKLPNAWGLFDMAGNVSEFCADYHDDGYYRVSPARNPRGPAKGHGRVMRGGSFCDDSYRMKSYYRGSYYETDSANGIGFRVVISGR